MKQNLSHFQIPGPFMNPTKKRSTHIGPLTYPDSKFQHGPAKKLSGPLSMKVIMANIVVD